MTSFSESRRIANGWATIQHQGKPSAMPYFLGSIGLCGLFAASALMLILLMSNTI